MGFPDGSVIKNLPDNAGAAGDSSLIPGWGSSPGGSNDNSLQYCCLENPIDRGALKSTVHRVAKVRHDLATKSPHKVLVKTERKDFNI